MNERYNREPLLKHGVMKELDDATLFVQSILEERHNIAGHFDKDVKEAIKSSIYKDPYGIDLLTHAAEPVKEFWKKANTKKISLAQLEIMPGAFYLSFVFTLKTDFVTFGNESFHLFENALHHDSIYRLPVYEASSWKGVLNHALIQRLKRLGSIKDRKNVRECRHRLFGTEKDKVASFLDKAEEKKDSEKKNNDVKEFGFKGRLWCYPTFFHRRSLQIINPHDRERRAGTVPVTMECVPAGSEGLFQILYFPHDALGKSLDEAELIYDYHMLCQSIYDALAIYGIGGKHLAGFGYARDNIKDVSVLTWKGPVEGITSLLELKNSAKLLVEDIGANESK
jgi:CRISPR/Cas system CMR subunit Cmr6 (Cas7 group RAMP superfamily)